MTEADYADISYGGTISNDKYTEKLTYDIRGNIQTLQRNGYNASNCSWGQIDNLTYQYDPNNQGYNPYNKLYSITDYADVSRGFITQSNGTAYSYDVDGNMTADPNKGITGISYNHLNLPEIITFTGNRTITFLYDGSGNKLRKTVVNSGVTQYTKDYVNGIEYKNNALEAIYHSEGRVTTIDGTLKYEYALKDHLGNTRIMFCDRNYDGIITPNSNAETSELTQENSYYAFGMNMEFGTWENTPSVTDNLHQYNGKELNTDFGLNWNDYGSRMYDASTARFTTIDNLSEASKSYSPYNYCENSPVAYVDLNGNFKMDPVQAKANPSLVGFLKALPQIYKDKPESFKQALREESGLSDSEILDIITYDHGPMLVIDDIDLHSKSKGNDGETFAASESGKLNQDVIGIDFKIAKAYHFATPFAPYNKFTNLKAKIYQVLESTVFHELTHYGHLKKGGINELHNSNENDFVHGSGNNFEIRAYGQVNYQRDFQMGISEEDKVKFFGNYSNDSDKQKEPEKKPIVVSPRHF